MLQLFPFLNILLQSGGKCGIVASVVLSLLLPQSAVPGEDYKMSSMDGEFTMEVVRDNQEVKIVLNFRDVSQYSHAMIEKTDELKNEFRQCAYVDLSEEKAKSGLIEKRDKYPRTYSVSYYRLRTVTKEGIERTYPPVRLPAKVQ